MCTFTPCYTLHCFLLFQKKQIIELDEKSIVVAIVSVHFIEENHCNDNFQLYPPPPMWYQQEILFYVKLVLYPFSTKKKLLIIQKAIVLWNINKIALQNKYSKGKNRNLLNILQYFVLLSKKYLCSPSPRYKA